ncbi:expressed unknown protein [Seminavis robusta]|uniref:Uncharacterized protein n=1 Tax=Seminavis robusta TaxID=568900 RepID=A0A9N8DBJ8_9STRA|nr:expressed unknown protein [Seminavis robusta]|eukprot:Sro25_g016870.1 n/a (855) ;mRNA; f:56955-59519
MSSSSSDDDANFLRLHAKSIAEALQQRDAAEQALSNATGATTTKSQREQLIHDTYIALCYDDPRVESDLGCQYLAMAMVDPKSPYALSGPLVEGIRQLCAKQQENSGAAVSSTQESSLSSPASAGSNTAKGSAMLAWAIGVRIPLLCCQASDLSQVDSLLGSYRPSPPPNPLTTNDTNNNDQHNLSHAIQNSSKQKLGEEADRLAAMLSQPLEEDNNATNGNNNIATNDEEEEVWAAESDPSDFEFESGFSYEQQIAEVEDSFAEWMIDRTDPIKLSTPSSKTSWKQVRHAVMDLTSQLNFRQVASLWTSTNNLQGLVGTRGPSNILTQFTLTLLVPPTITTNKPSVFDSPDDDEDALQPHRQLQAMAWHPLWVMRDAAAANTTSTTTLSEYLTMLQTLIAIDAAAAKPPSEGMAPATYVGLASLSALCQQFMTEASTTTTGQQQLVERFRILRRSVWGTCDDLAHAMEQEEKIRKTAAASSQKSSENWIVWTLLPLFEVMTNQKLQTGSTIVAKAESLAQQHHNQQQASQQWSAGLLQTGLLRHWLLKCQELGQQQEEDGSPSLLVLLQFVRRSLLFMIAQSMTSTSALGKYAWRFPNFGSIVEIGMSYYEKSKKDDPDVDAILWNMLAMELAGNVAASAPTIQWKNKASTVKPLPSRLDCHKAASVGYQDLCCAVVRVLELACEEENKKENLNTSSSEEKNTTQQEDKLQHQVILRSFQRFVDCLAACPLLARLFVQDLTSDKDTDTSTSTSCLNDIQTALSQYKAPSPDDATGPKAKDEDAADVEGQAVLENTRAAKEQVQSASLQEEIHLVRKDLKVLRSILATKASSSGTTSAAGFLVPQELTSSSKTD